MIQCQDHLFVQYGTAEIVDTNGKPWAGSASLPFPLFIITAHNPYSIKTLSINHLLHDCLRAFVSSRFPAASWEPVIGQSVDGQWKELSLAISGISQQQAIQVGEHFAQWAIFRLDEQGLAVLRCQCLDPDEDQAMDAARKGNGW